MAEIFGNTTTTPINPNAFAGGEGGQGVVVNQTYDGTSENAVSNKAIDDHIKSTYCTEEQVNQKISTIELAVIVSELPETATPNKIYLIPKATTEDVNVFDEYLWVNDTWEYIGSIQAQIDLSNYVKKTDYATKSGGAGVIRVGSANGIYITSAGYLQTYPATKSDIEGRTQGYRPIVPTTIDYAVHSALKTFITEMSNATTFEQLKTACTNYLNSIS